MPYQDTTGTNRKRTNRKMTDNSCIFFLANHAQIQPLYKVFKGLVFVVLGKMSKLLTNFTTTNWEPDAFIKHVC